MFLIFRLVFLVIIFSVRGSFAQEAEPAPLTNYDEFVSIKSGFVTIEDYTIPRLILSLSYGDARIRKVTSGQEVKLYYQITSGDYLGSVSADNFPFLLDAYKNLQSQTKADVKPSADLLMKKYTDRDGLELGYTVEGKKITWFIKPHRLNRRILYVKDPNSLEESLTQAAKKLQELK